MIILYITGNLKESFEMVEKLVLRVFLKAQTTYGIVVIVIKRGCILGTHGLWRGLLLESSHLRMTTWSSESSIRTTSELCRNPAASVTPRSYWIWIFTSSSWDDAERHRIEICCTEQGFLHLQMHHVFAWRNFSKTPLSLPKIFSLVPLQPGFSECFLK